MKPRIDDLHRLHLVDPTLYEWAAADASIEMDHPPVLLEW